jgi:transposase
MLALESNGGEIAELKSIIVRQELKLAEKDKIIAQQAELIAQQAELIAQQAERITQQAERIAQQDKRIVELEAKLEKQQHQLDNLLRHQFGQRSEKELLESNAGLEAEDGEAALEEAEDFDIEFETITYERRKRKGRKERLTDDLPRIPCYYGFSESGPLMCSCGCGRTLRQMGLEIKEELVVEPEKVYVLQHIRPKFGGCFYDSEIIIAPMLASPIKGGLAAAETIAHIAVNKYQDHLPLYRQQQRFLRSGIDISRQTMCDWMAAGANVLNELLQLLKPCALANPIMHTDDTPMPVQAPGTKKTKQGRLWVYAGRGGEGDVHPYIFYDYSPDRCAKWPQARLAGYEGFIQADAYPGYDTLFKKPKGHADKKPDAKLKEGKATEIACWMHARRPFYNIAKNSKSRGLAYQAVQRIKKLYAIEKKGKDMSDDERYELRQKEAVPILEAFKIWLDEKKSQVMAKTPIEGAINYSLNQWAALCCYTEDGRLSIGRVENWRAGLRLLVAHPVLSLWASIQITITAFPVPARQTGRALLTHPAFVQSHTFALGTSALLVATL